MIHQQWPCTLLFNGNSLSTLSLCLLSQGIQWQGQTRQSSCRIVTSALKSSFSNSQDSRVVSWWDRMREVYSLQKRRELLTLSHYFPHLKGCDLGFPVRFSDSTVVSYGNSEFLLCNMLKQFPLTFSLSLYVVVHSLLISVTSSFRVFPTIKSGFAHHLSQINVKLMWRA